jgi:hypothetical protein
MGKQCELAFMHESSYISVMENNNKMLNSCVCMCVVVAVHECNNFSCTNRQMCGCCVDEANDDDGNWNAGNSMQEIFNKLENVFEIGFHQN